MKEKIEAVTLFERADGKRTMKLGAHEPRAFLGVENGLVGESAEVVALDEPKREIELQHADDFPERVQEFFGVKEAE